MDQQLKMVNLKCPNCGGILEISAHMERFACGYCGSEQIVERRGGTIGLRLIVDGVARVQVGTDKTAAELALIRLEKELGTAQNRWQEADKQFRLHNEPNSGPLAVLIFSAIVFVWAITISANTPSMDSAIVSISLACGAVGGFIWAVKLTGKNQKRYSEQRSDFSRSHEIEIQRLQTQIANAQSVVQA